MEFRRRSFLLEEHEPLLLSRSALKLAERVTQFSQISGIPESALTMSPLCAIPMPIWPGDFGTSETGRPRRRWEGVRPEFMWHPLMWLPEHMSGLYQIQKDDGTVKTEDLESWQARLALELTQSGLYDPLTGTWLDILDSVGIDVEDDLDQARIQDWLDGEPDEVLDAIDLTSYLVVDTDPHWGVSSLLRMREDLIGGSLALVADEMLSIVDDIQAPENEVAVTEQAQTLQAVGDLAQTSLARVQRTNTLGVPNTPDNVRPTVFFANAAQEVASPSCSPLRVRELLATAADRLYLIRENHWHHLENLANERPGGEEAVLAPVPQPV